MLFTVALRHEFREWLADNFFRRIAKDSFRSGVPGHNIAVAVRVDHCVIRSLANGLIAFNAAAQGVLRLTQAVVLCLEFSLAELELGVGNAQRHLLHFSRGDVLRRADQVIEAAICGTYGFDIGINISDRSVLANDALFKGRRVDLAANDAFNLFVSLCKIIRMGQILPGDVPQLFVRIAGENAGLFVDLEEASGLRLDDDHADERHVEKILFDLVGSGLLSLQVVALGFFSLSPEREQGPHDDQYGNEGDRSKPEDRLPEGRQDFAAVDFCNQIPGSSADRAIGGEHRLIAVVFALHFARLVVEDCAYRRHFCLAKGYAHAQGRDVLMTEVAQIEDIVPVSLHQQVFTALAGGWPLLDVREGILFKTGKGNDEAGKNFLPILLSEQCGYKAHDRIAFAAPDQLAVLYADSGCGYREKFFDFVLGIYLVRLLVRFAKDLALCVKYLNCNVIVGAADSVQIVLQQLA